MTEAWVATKTDRDRKTLWCCELRACRRTHRHVLCPAHAALRSGYPQPRAAHCGIGNWEPDRATRAALEAMRDEDEREDRDRDREDREDKGER